MIGPRSVRLWHRGRPIGERTIRIPVIGATAGRHRPEYIDPAVRYVSPGHFTRSRARRIGEALVWVGLVAVWVALAGCVFLVVVWRR